jgi:hypothetical protein
MGLVEQTLRSRVKKFDEGRLNGAGAANKKHEQMVLSGLHDSQLLPKGDFPTERYSTKPHLHHKPVAIVSCRHRQF